MTPQEHLVLFHRILCTFAGHAQAAGLTIAPEQNKVIKECATVILERLNQCDLLEDPELAATAKLVDGVF